MQKTFEVAEEYAGRVEALVTKLNRKAARLGVEPITLVKKSIGLRSVDRTYPGSETRFNVWLNFVSLEISLNVPKLAGWEFICTIQHGDAGNLILTVPREVPIDLSAFRVGPARCCHCNLDRNRLDTYVVRNEAGELKQVGKQCLSAFTGSGGTPEQAAALAEWLSQVGEVFNGDGEDDGDEPVEKGSRVGDGFGLDLFLACVVNLSNEYGFVTSKIANEQGKSSTGSDAGFRVRIAELGKHYTEADVAEAKAARDWAKALVPANDFEHNLHTVALSDGVTFRNVGIAAYIVEAYRRSKAEAIKKAARPASAHFGTVGVRLRKLALTYLGSSSFETNFGLLFIHRFLAAEGDAVWKTGSVDGSSFEVGKSYLVDASVKEHGDYKGRSQTVITRVKVLE